MQMVYRYTGKLLCMTDYSPVYVVENKYYYKLEITVL